MKNFFRALWAVMAVLLVVGVVFICAGIARENAPEARIRREIREEAPRERAALPGVDAFQNVEAAHA